MNFKQLFTITLMGAALTLNLACNATSASSSLAPSIYSAPIDPQYSSPELVERLASEYPKPSRYEEAIAKFEAADAETPQPAGAIVAYGSSSIVGWHKSIKKDLEPLTIIPRGFGGSNMFDALHFAERAAIKYQPRAILLYEGDNDVWQKVSPASIRDAYLALAAKIHAALPETRIYFISIKPSISRWEKWPQMAEANALIRAECDARFWMTYIDVATPMLGADGQPLPDIFLSDNLHLNAKGYDIWAAAVKPVLMERELMFESK